MSLAPEISQAGHTAMSQQADGTIAYVGFMHTKKLARQVRLYPSTYKDHGAKQIPTGKFKYHINAVLFDADSHKRITNAEVRARVAPLGFGGSFKLLEPMLTAGVIEYCDYLDIRPSHRYRVDLSIKIPGRPNEIRMRFDHELPE
jgi:hypothetical protein|tara:strand:- start:4397 stop:4831 length:435 start_codon:yes stop_codon:yes gene_type:complete